MTPEQPGGPARRGPAATRCSTASPTPAPRRSRRTRGTPSRPPSRPARSPAPGPGSTVKTGGQRPDGRCSCRSSRVRRARPAHVGPDRRHRRRRRGRHRDPPDRHSQGARLHPGPGRAGLRRSGADPGRRSGAVLGVVAGNLVAVPLLADTEDLYGTVAADVAPGWTSPCSPARWRWSRVTASAAAARAGRLRTVDALAVGRTPGRRPRAVRRAGSPRGCRCPGR